jgi:hypothetical protein
MGDGSLSTDIYKLIKILSMKRQLEKKAPSTHLVHGAIG